MKSIIKTLQVLISILTGLVTMIILFDEFYSIPEKTICGCFLVFGVGTLIPWGEKYDHFFIKPKSYVFKVYFTSLILYLLGIIFSYGWYSAITFISLIIITNIYLIKQHLKPNFLDILEKEEKEKLLNKFKMDQQNRDGYQVESTPSKGVKIENIESIIYLKDKGEITSNESYPIQSSKIVSDKEKQNLEMKNNNEKSVDKFFIEAVSERHNYFNVSITGNKNYKSIPIKKRKLMGYNSAWIVLYDDRYFEVVDYNGKQIAKVIRKKNMTPGYVTGDSFSIEDHSFKKLITFNNKGIKMKENRL